MSVDSATGSAMGIVAAGVPIVAGITVISAVDRMARQAQAQSRPKPQPRKRKATQSRRKHKDPYSGFLY